MQARTVEILTAVAYLNRGESKSVQGQLFVRVVETTNRNSADTRRRYTSLKARLGKFCVRETYLLFPG